MYDDNQPPLSGNYNTKIEFLFREANNLRLLLINIMINSNLLFLKNKRDDVNDHKNYIPQSFTNDPIVTYLEIFSHFLEKNIFFLSPIYW